MFEENETRNNDREMLRAVKSFLREDEEILWMGQPYKSVNYRPGGYMIFFSLFFLGFALFWTVTASIGGGFFGLFGIPFICIGIGLLYGTLFGAKKTFRNTVYAVTPLRAIIIVATRQGMQCRDYYFANTPSVQISAMQGDCGTIDLCPHLNYDTPYYDYNGGYGYRGGNRVRIGGRRFSTGTRDTFTAFEMIDNVHEVYALITDCITKSH